MDNVVRSSGFSDKPTPQPDMDVFDAPKRDDRLALVEDIEIGPADFKPPFDDPHFKQLEPNSGIRLSCVFTLSSIKPQSKSTQVSHYPS